MRKLILALSAASLAVPATVVPVSQADARTHYRGTYHHRTKVCRRTKGHTGMILGGTAGAVAGHAILGGPVGIVAGAVGGALGGRAVERGVTAKQRCYYR